MTVDGSESASTFKHLFSNTYYSFAVTAVNNAGEGLQHISPKKERTETGKSKNRCFLLLNNHCLLSPAPSSPSPHPYPSYSSFLVFFPFLFSSHPCSWCLSVHLCVIFESEAKYSLCMYVCFSPCPPTHPLPPPFLPHPHPLLLSPPSPASPLPPPSSPPLTPLPLISVEYSNEKFNSS